MKFAPYLLSSAALALLVAVTACGGGDGSPVNETPGVTSLSRAAPGLQVTIVAASSPVPGEAVTLDVDLKPDAGEPAVSVAEIQIGNDYDHMVPSVAGVRDTNDLLRWRFTLVVPSTIADSSCYLLRLTREDGSVIEVGRGDFALAAIH